MVRVRIAQVEMERRVKGHVGQSEKERGRVAMNLPRLAQWWCDQLPSDVARYDATASADPVAWRFSVPHLQMP